MVKVRCHECNKQINEIYSSIGKCRCDNIYCAKHIQSHNCKFDYMYLYQKNNKMVKVECDKLIKI